MGHDGVVTPSSALATVIVSALWELGVRHVVLCPGSRSAPSAYALADAADQGQIQLQVRIDERSAGFVALGLARGAGGGHPAAIVTTSGTAVANLHPAVLEASHAGVPLLVLSADRPHELRGTGANQTTDQVQHLRHRDAVVRRDPGTDGPAPARSPAGATCWPGPSPRDGRSGAIPGRCSSTWPSADPLTPDPRTAPDRVRRRRGRIR